MEEEELVSRHEIFKYNNHVLCPWVAKQLDLELKTLKASVVVIQWGLREFQAPAACWLLPVSFSVKLSTT